MDIAEALTKTKNSRVYWATIKRRNPQLIAICKQLKLKAKDGKFYNTDHYAFVYYYFDFCTQKLTGYLVTA